MSEEIVQTLAGYSALMNAAGKEFGRRVRQEHGKPLMPCSVVEGSTRLSEDLKAMRFDRWRIVEMWRLGLTTPDASAPAGRKAISLQEFLDKGGKRHT